MTKLRLHSISVHVMWEECWVTLHHNVKGKAMADPINKITARLGRYQNFTKRALIGHFSDTIIV